MYKTCKSKPLLVIPFLCSHSQSLVYMRDLSVKVMVFPSFRKHLLRPVLDVSAFMEMGLEHHCTGEPFGKLWS